MIKFSLLKIEIDDFRSKSISWNINECFQHFFLCKTTGIVHFVGKIQITAATSKLFAKLHSFNYNEVSSWIKSKMNTRISFAFLPTCISEIFKVTSHIIKVSLMLLTLQCIDHIFLLLNLLLNPSCVLVPPIMKGRDIH